MHSNTSLNYEVSVLINWNFISYMCGLMVQKYVYSLRINAGSFAHYTQQKNKRINYQQLYSLLCSICTHVLHTLVIQISSVTIRFCTLYTGPTITTTYNIFKKG